tara:strand:- start:78 stop:317 length:240 start_codon:yes stop_codon:yes gene_type:complete
MGNISLERSTRYFNYKLSEKNLVTFSPNFSYKFIHPYKIKTIVKNAYAYEVSLQACGLIIRINRKPAIYYKIEDIVYGF